MFTLLMCLLHYCSFVLFSHLYDLYLLLFLCCRVFGADIQGRDCGDESSRWLTRYLGEETTFRLVHFEPQMKARRSVEMEPLFSQYEVNETMSRRLCRFLFLDFKALTVCLYLRYIFYTF